TVTRRMKPPYKQRSSERTPRRHYRFSRCLRPTAYSYLIIANKPHTNWSRSSFTSKTISALGESTSRDRINVYCKSPHPPEPLENRNRPREQTSSCQIRIVLAFSDSRSK